MSRNLLLGCGENLVTALPRPKGHPLVKNHPYVDPEEVYARLCPQMNDTCGYLSDLAPEYCPVEDEISSMFRCIVLHLCFVCALSCEVIL